MTTFGSVCSGIEAASVAWARLGWQAAWFSEIEPSPCALLQHHYPTVPNYGDMTALPARIRSDEVEAPDILCGGTPCQAFSVAGKRESLDDARGNLSLTFCEIADAIDDVRSVRDAPPIIVFWENVPGVLSTADNAFGCFLAGLAGESEPLLPEPCPPAGKSSRYWHWNKKAGNHTLSWPVAGCVIGPRRTVAWRTLDAQYFGLAQRRRRVFVVASARYGFDPAEVLFEFDGMRRDTAPSREAGQDAADNAARSVALRGREGGATAELGDEVQNCLRASGGGGDKAHVIAGTLSARTQGGGGLGTDFELAGGLQPVSVADLSPVPTSCWWDGGQVSQTLDAVLSKGQCMPEKNRFPAVLTPCCVTGEITHALKADGFDGSDDGTGRGQPIVVHGTQDPCTDDHVAFALGRNTGQENAVAFQGRGSNIDLGQDVTGTLSQNCDRASGGAPCVATTMKVRRLTPRECERLQGFPDDYTNIPKKVIRQAVPATAGPCFKQTVTATVVAKNGTHFVASNWCAGPQQSCPREGLQTGVGYDKCTGICGQSGHAEVNAIKLAGKRAAGGDLYIEGHTYACDSCMEFAQQAGIKNIRFGKPRGTTADGPRYKALGNSWAVNCVVWIGNRIESILEKSQ